ncbi:unnamed protein product, partial [Phaeothamnion confervicola]
VTLGGAVYLEKLPDRVKILGENVPKPFSGGERRVVDCATDESVGLAVALRRAVLVPRGLWEAASTRASFVMNGGRMRLGVDIRGAKVSQADVMALGASGRVAGAAALPPPDRISKRQFLSMSAADKRAVLRAAGVRPPRRRQAQKAAGGRDGGGATEALDDLLLPLMDETVRRDVLIHRAVERENYAAAASLSEGKSERHVVAERLAEAVATEDFPLAARLRERLDWLQQLRADMTQDEGSYQKDLD